MKTFDFDILGKQCSFTLRDMSYANETYVDPSIYRPSIVDARKATPANAMDFKDYVRLAEFIEDVNCQIRWSYITSDCNTPNIKHFYEACNYACEKHIKKFNRLILTDLFSYVDVFSLIIKSYFNLANQQVQSHYVQCLKQVGEKYNAFIQCPTMFGSMQDFRTWARIKGL